MKENNIKTIIKLYAYKVSHRLDLLTRCRFAWEVNGYEPDDKQIAKWANRLKLNKSIYCK